MMRDEAWPDRLIEEARRGDDAARGILLELYRNYLRLVARSLIGGALADQARSLGPGPGDVLEGPPGLRPVRGRDGARAGGLAAADPRAEPGQPGQAPPPPGARPASPGVAGSPARAVGPGPPESPWPRSAPSPSEAASHREQAVLLADAVDRLSPDYREAFVLRTLEHVPFEEIAARMGRSTGAVRMLWARAVKKLNQMLDTSVGCETGWVAGVRKVLAEHPTDLRMAGVSRDEQRRHAVPERQRGRVHRPMASSPWRWKPTSRRSRRAEADRPATPGGRAPGDRRRAAVVPGGPPAGRAGRGGARR